MADFKIDRRNPWRNAWALLKSYRTYVSAGPFADLNRMLLFTGYPRSGHTLLAALLDAHPQILLAHQAYALEYFQRGIAKERVFQILHDNATRFTAAGRQWMGYDYQIPGQWQGRYQDLRLIGDKSGGITARKIFQQGDFKSLEAVTRQGVQPIFLHVLRNPYDIVTTMAKRSMARQNKSVTARDLDRKIEHFMKHAVGVSRLKQHGVHIIYDVYSEDVIRDTRGVMTRLLERLDLLAEPDYLRACDELVWDQPRTSRHSLPFWTPERVERFAERLRPFPWFARYTFTE